jgi:hypothetical protein
MTALDMSVLSFRVTFFKTSSSESGLLWMLFITSSKYSYTNFFAQLSFLKHITFSILHYFKNPYS